MNNKNAKPALNNAIMKMQAEKNTVTINLWTGLLLFVCVCAKHKIQIIFVNSMETQTELRGESNEWDPFKRWTWSSIAKVGQSDDNAVDKLPFSFIWPSLYWIDANFWNHKYWVPFFFFFLLFYQKNLINEFVCRTFQHGFYKWTWLLRRKLMFGLVADFLISRKLTKSETKNQKEIAKKNSNFEWTLNKQKYAAPSVKIPKRVCGSWNTCLCDTWYRRFAVLRWQPRHWNHKSILG